MIKRKKDECGLCGGVKFIYAKKLCHSCYTFRQKQNQKAIPKISKKQKVRIGDYSIARAEYLEKHIRCEARVECVGDYATEIHHSRGRIGNLLTDKKNFLAVCRRCHTWIEENPAKAKELGFSKNRL